MKFAAFLFLIFLKVNAFSQPNLLRIFNDQDRKIAVGLIKELNDSILYLEKSQVFISDIKYVKTNRSAGNLIAKGVPLGATSFALTAMRLEYEAQNILVATAVGIVFGAATGAVFSIIKESKTYTINGSSDAVKMMLDDIAADQRSNQIKKPATVSE